MWYRIWLIQNARTKRKKKKTEKLVPRIEVSGGRRRRRRRRSGRIAKLYRKRVVGAWMPVTKQPGLSFVSDRVIRQDHPIVVSPRVDRSFVVSRAEATLLHLFPTFYFLFLMFQPGRRGGGGGGGKREHSLCLSKYKLFPTNPPARLVPHRGLAGKPSSCVA